MAALFFAAAIAMAGLPPLSGFVGKLLILDATASDPRAVWVWAVVLIGSLVAVIGFARAGSTLFWKAHAPGVAAAGPVPAGEDPVPARPALPVVAIGALLAALVAVTVFAGPVQRSMAATAQQLFAPIPYIKTVLETPGRQITYKGHGGGGHGTGTGDSAPADSHGAEAH